MHVLLLSFHLGECVQSTSVTDARSSIAVEDGNKHFPHPSAPSSQITFMQKEEVRRLFST